MFRKLSISIVLVLLLIIGGFFYFRYQVYYSHGNSKENKTFSIKKGKGNAQIADELKKAGIISGKIYFYYYLKTNALSEKILPGEYEISGNLTIPEIVQMFSQKREKFARVTFPEGWSSKKMASRLSENGLPGDEFLKLVENPEVFRNQYEFLKDPKIKNLEGYLFPDTYFFSPKSTAETIVSKMLQNFSEKMENQMLEDMKKRGKSMKEILTMASIIEMEVKSQGDREIVSGIFWKRIETGRPLQSCATIAYILGVNKKQYSFEDTRIKSPYNTYINPGLPPGPIGNPGISSIRAAVYPKTSEFLYFLSDPETGKTYFARTIDEHNENKVKFGL